jgi:UPF0755 protein
MNRRPIIAFALLLLAIGAGTAGWYVHSLYAAAQQPSHIAATADFEVKPGSSLRTVLQSLQKQGLIGDARRVEYFLRCCQHGSKLGGEGIKAGHYRINPGQSPLEILRLFVEGRVVLEQLTIVDGWRFSQMRTAIESHPGIDKTLAGRNDAEIMVALERPGVAAEGQFAPDTYSFARGTTDLQIYRMAFSAQRAQLLQAWQHRQDNLPFATPDEALTMASIVEKETGLASERARIAGVFINRLRIGMLLQTDPTVIYGLGDKYDGNIRRRDLSTDTPYNTYTRKGLPPTPIALPGKDAIIATLNPEASASLFFVAIGDGSGGHYFSATLAEHNRAVQRYLERLRVDPPGGAVAAPGTGTP